jgi:hypothetical protein
MDTGYHRSGWQSRIGLSTDKDKVMAPKTTLTPKQRHFARCVAGGMTQADAYREAYNPKPSTTAASIHTLASRVAGRVEVRSRIEALVAARERAVAASAVTDRQKVTAHLRDALAGGETDQLRLRAAELLGRSAGLFATEMTLNTHVQRDPTEVAAAIQQRLSQLTGASDDESPEQLGNALPDSESPEIH